MPRGGPAQPHHHIVLVFHDIVVHGQDLVSFLETLVVGRGAWLHPAHLMPSLAQPLLQVKTETPALLFAQQTESRPLQVPGTWRGEWAAEKGDNRGHTPSTGPLHDW